VPVTTAPIWANKTRYRILVAPIQLLTLRLRGYQIINFHFIQEHFQPLSVKSDRGRKIFYIWHKFFLRLAKLIGFKLVWTGHNLVPHERVFLNDELARQFLVDHCDLVIATNDTAAINIEEKFHPKSMTTIYPAINEIVPSGNFQQVRENIGISPNRIVFSHLGRLRPYKGTLQFLDVIGKQELNATFLIAGSKPQGEDEHIHSIEAQVVSLNDHGKDVRLNINFITDEELANYYLASNFLVYPLTNVTTSGIISHALIMGIPLIIPDLPDFSWIPQAAAIRYQHRFGAESLGEVMREAMELSKEQRQVIVDAGKEFSADWTWPKVAEAYKKTYLNLV